MPRFSTSTRLRAAGRALHANEVVERGDEDPDAAEIARLGIRSEDLSTQGTEQGLCRSRYVLTEAEASAKGRAADAADASGKAGRATGPLRRRSSRTRTT